MKTNEHLYGSGVAVPSIPQHIIDIRIRLLKKNLTRLLKVNYMKRDKPNIDSIIDAIDFWEQINNK